jgi:hypothetical protein
MSAASIVDDLTFGKYEDVIINYEEALALETMFDSDDIHSAAFFIHCRAMFSENISVEEAMERIGPSIIEKPPQADRDLFFNTYYRPMAQDSFRNLLVHGYSVYKLIECQDPMFSNRMMKVPVVIPRAEVDVICRKWYSGHKQWLIKPRKGLYNLVGKHDAGDPSYHIFFMDFCTPCLVTGRHRSVVSPTMKHCKYIDQLYECLIEANKQRSHPPVCYEPVPAQAGNQLTVVALPNANVLRAQDEALQDRAKIAIDETMVIHNMQQLIGHKRGAEDMITDPHDPQTGVKKFLPTVLDNVHFIPSGFKLGGQPALPDPPQNILELDSDRKEHILANHGIPPSLVLSGARNNSKTTTNMVDDNDLVSFSRTVRLNCRTVERLLTEVYLRSFPDLSGRSDLKFRVKPIPFTSPAAVHRMFESGVLKKKSRNHMVLALNGMDQTDEAEEEEEIVRPPQNGNENQTTANMKAKEKVMLAEAQEREANAKARIAEIEGKTNETKGQKEVLEMQFKLEELKIKGQIEILKLKIEAEKAKAKTAKATPKPSSSSKD